MKFYGRQEELQVLAKTRELTSNSSQMTVVMGRRRVGKTRMLLHSQEDRKKLYFFVSKKAENLLCEDFLRQIKEVYQEEAIGAITEFQQIFQLICRIAQRRHVDLIIDEFQEFSSINASIFSEMQRDWDLNKSKMSLNLILCGSVQSMMTRIFLDGKEPLYGRASSVLRIGPFQLSTLRQIMSEHNPGFKEEDLLTLYVVTGGVAQYIEWLVESKALTRNTILSTVFHPHSVFLTEGKNALIQDVGKEYATYFSILSLIAAGFTTRPKIESVLQRPIGGFVMRLERVYGIINRRRAIFSKENTTDIRFYIADPFFRFWFRFIFKYQEMVEANNLRALRELVDRDFQTFAGLSLESFLREQLRESGAYTRVGNYWEKGNQNEIDIVAIHEINRTAIIGEVKWQRSRVNLAKLELKATKLIKNHLAGYQIEFRAFGLEDVKTGND